MGRALRQAVLSAALLAAGLAGCGSIGDTMPEAVGGLPAGAPARPAAPYGFPAVHDMPPDRALKPLTEEDQVKLEKDLQGTRDRQEAREGQEPDENQDSQAAAPAKKKAATPAKKKPNTAKTSQNTGAKTNP